ncbi:MAG: ABC transporter substrate-binding protein [Synergistaceae bacterium]|nr:ABC transporter substrate-binding protein [Synergistaceae bacterium]
MLIALSENDDADLLPDLPRVSLRSGAERLLALRPDIVITRSFAVRLNPNMYDVLKRSGVKVIVIDPPEWEDFTEYLMTLAESLSLDSASALRKFADIISGIRERVPSRKAPRVFLEATSRELHTCSPDSWAAKLIAIAGGINIASSAEPLRPGSAVAPFGVERVLENAGNLDVYIIQTGAMNASHAEDFRAREWSGALGNVKVCEIPERYISRPSLLGLERAGELLLKALWEDE